MLTVNQKFCIQCGTRIEWDEIRNPSFHEPVNGQARYYIRGECPNRRLMTDTGHSYGLVTDVGPGGEFPIPYGALDDHEALKGIFEKIALLDSEEVTEDLAEDQAQGVGGG